MPTLRELMGDADQVKKLDAGELESLADLVYIDGGVSRAEAGFLFELLREVGLPTPALENLFVVAVKRHLLADGVIGRAETAWLGRMAPRDEMSQASERLFRELREQADETCAEFESLYSDRMGFS